MSNEHTSQYLVQQLDRTTHENKQLAKLNEKIMHERDQAVDTVS
jgi:hypothetical protein